MSAGLADAGSSVALSRPASFAAGLRGRPGPVLAVLCSAQLILSVDITVVNVANASIERALGFTAANLQWTITSYSLTFGGFLLLGGRLGDLFGRRRMFLAGIVAFALASLGAGLARNTIELIAARAVQGLCAAAISPAGLSLIASTFREGRTRQRALGIWAGFGSIGGLTGFFIGGVVTTYFGWRWIFLMNVPICALAIVGTMLWVRIEPRKRARRRHLDLPGALSITTAAALVIFGLGEAQTTSWSSTPTIATLALAPVLLVLFVVLERLTAEPLIPVTLLRRRAAVANLISAFQQSSGIAATFLAPLFLQQVWGFSPLRAGAGALPLPVGFVFGAHLSSRLVGRLGAKRLILVGFVILTIGLVAMAMLPSQSNYFTTFFPALSVRSFGQGLVLVPLVVTITSGVRHEDQGAAAGLFTMSQQLGGALGLAAIATVVAAGSRVGPSHIAAASHGFRLGFLIAAGTGVAGGLTTLFALKTPIGERDAPPPDFESDAVAIDIGTSASP